MNIFRAKIESLSKLTLGLNSGLFKTKIGLR